MKILIMFMALAVLNTMFFVYQTDMNGYIRENTFVKATAEECAAGASLFYDEEALSEGYYEFNRDECEKYIRYIVEKSFPDLENIVYEIVYYDTDGNPDPAIEVVINSKDRDRFRLPFLRKDNVKRAAYYEHSGY